MATVADLVVSIRNALGTFFLKTGGELTGRTVISLPTTAPADTSGEQPSVNLSSSTITTGTNPATPQYWGIYFTDSSKLTDYDGRIAAIECAVRDTGQVSLNIAAYQFVSGKSAWSGSILSATILADGTRYVTLPTPAAGDNSTKAATTAWVTTALGGYLPLTGGTISGTIIASQTDLNIRKSITTGRTILRGSTDYNTGASLYLNGKDYSGSVAAGAWELVAHNGSATKSLRGEPGGALIWTGSSFTVGGTTVALSTDLSAYLPLAGGTLTGTIVSAVGNLIYRNSTTGYTRISGGSAANKGANLLMYGEASSSNTGQAILYAANTTQSTFLRIYPTGQIDVGGTSKVLTVGLGEHTFSGIGAHGYLTSSATTLTFYVPIIVIGSSVTITTLTGSGRVGTGGYTSPGGSTAESLIPSGVTQAVAITANCLRVTLTKSAGWGATNNSTVSVMISSLKFTVS